MITHPAEQHPLTDLLGLFRELNIEGISEHDFVDYLFVRTGIDRLSDLTPEDIIKYKKVLTGIRGKEKTKMEFRKFLLEIQAKLQKSGWGAFEK